MDASIFIEIEDNKINFILNLTFDFMEINEQEYFNYNETIIYQSTDSTINETEFNKKIENLNEKLKNSFPNKNICICNDIKEVTLL